VSKKFVKLGPKSEARPGDKERQKVSTPNRGEKEKDQAKSNLITKREKGIVRAFYQPGVRKKNPTKPGHHTRKGVRK